MLLKIKYTGAIGIEIVPEPDDYKAVKQAISYLRVIEKKINRGEEQL